MNIDSKSFTDPRSELPAKFSPFYRTDILKYQNPELRRSRKGRLYAIPSNKSMLLLIDNRLSDLVAYEAQRFAYDLEDDGWYVVAKVYDGGDIWAVRDEIAAMANDSALPPLDGVELIGQIPVPRYLSRGPGEPNWNGYLVYPNDGWPVPPSLCMYFYGNVKAEHGYTRNGTDLVYHVKTAGKDNWTPDIWVSVIRGHWLPVLGGGMGTNGNPDVEAGIIRKYLDKNHSVRTGEIPEYRTGIVACADNVGQADDFQKCLQAIIGGEVEKYFGGTLPEAVWRGHYDWACFSSHGGPHGFLNVHADAFYNNPCDIKFADVFACKTGNFDLGRYEAADCVSQSMAMSPRNSIVTVFSGSDYNAGMGDLREYVEPIKKGNTVGKAYSDRERIKWFAGWDKHQCDGERGIKWPIEPFGAVIFGDGSFCYRQAESE
jgi:hypothetical protein